MTLVEIRNHKVIKSYGIESLNSVYYHVAALKNSPRPTTRRFYAAVTFIVENSAGQIEAVID